MCLRYAFATTDFKALKERFKVDDIPKMEPRYNIAPTQEVPVILGSSPERISLSRWGIEAPWSSHPLFNARAESIDEKPSFKEDFSQRRCLMLADSFYEWKNRRPFRFHLKGEGAFAFAGIYSEEGGCCMITASSNALVGKVHDRMPVILRMGLEKEYLEAGVADAKRMLKPYPESDMGMHEVSALVNSAKNEGPQLIRPKKSLMDYM